MKILVTGAAGFIGYHLCKKLAKEGYKVYGIDNINNYYDPNLKLNRLNDLGINFNQYLTDEIKEMFLINEDDHKKIPNGDLHSAFRIHIDKVKGGLKYRK